jgi:hypothetical protein
MRVVERDWAACPGQARAKIPERVVGQKGASDDARLRGALVFYDHARGRAHHALRRFAENAPACLRYLRHIDGRIHFRENHQRHRVIRVERDAELGEEAGKTAAQHGFRLARQISAGDVDREAVVGEPDEPVDGRCPTAPASLQLMDGAALMVDRHTQGQTVAKALSQSQKRRFHLVHRLHRISQHHRAKPARQRILEPFLQTIQDLSVRRMAVGRIALVGDAAFIPRPHTAASTAKAAGNALALVDALKRETDIPAALRAWEPDQIQFGLHLRRQGKLLGDQSQKRYPEPRPT